MVVLIVCYIILGIIFLMFNYKKVRFDFLLQKTAVVVLWPLLLYGLMRKKSLK